ncbi:excisionase family DNA-binding protein [bacterium]|nr:excisionase family DNA-binding protein [bacterium]
MKPTEKLLNKNFLTTGQAATLLSVTPDSVLKWIKAGKMPASRTPGGHFRINQQDILSILPEATINEMRTHTKSFQYCWEYNSDYGVLKEGCNECLVYISRAKRCYEVSYLSKEDGHSKLFCDTSCEDCEYFKLVSDQKLNLLIVTDKPELRKALEPSINRLELNVRFTDCEYKCSMLVEKYRPDYGVIDCALGSRRAREFAGNLNADPRIPFIRVILVGERNEFPSECDKEIFAFIERPLSITAMNDLFSHLSGALRRSKSSEVDSSNENRLIEILG